MKDKIARAIRETELEHGVRVLFACESGSRAWGFESVNSDYDVRFLYVRPVAGYLTVLPHRDVIEAMLPDDSDLAGWDLRKTLQLLTKSNPSLFEWFSSPIVYAQDAAFVEEFRDIADRWYSTRRIFMHYLHMAQGNWLGYLQRETVSRKKYLYVLRPALACLWLEANRGAVPMEFDTLRHAVVGDSDVARAIDHLVEAKRAGEELAAGPPDPTLHRFLAAELERLHEVKWKDAEPPEFAELDRFLFRWSSLTG
ncbi:nucleotidyltransferase domain-containing protein [Fimbriimonas ginsengisoli]|uniref:Nucleotidyltransferase-like protein n=1 Tax=Fimbriimonas ginsengisoli Gsoil 348 TaxID=661478 RepID=A0A068NPC0_FIMGI|nr:nucleotidyltransferase domain-containing protein [Fimbriimonas ginsengisoli]AIE83434.1 nucleotidyltransferase-like protein [Fimbriimonas ginsengisoli Gsoil 348]